MPETLSLGLSVWSFKFRVQRVGFRPAVSPVVKNSL